MGFKGVKTILAYFRDVLANALQPTVSFVLSSTDQTVPLKFSKKQGNGRLIVCNELPSLRSECHISCMV